MSTARKFFKKPLLITFSALVVILAGASVFLYYNFNKLLSDALMKSFNSSIISDVYTLKFERLSVNLIKGDIQVYDVAMEPRDTLSQQYTYINSFGRLKTHKLALRNVQLKLLVQSHVLRLDSIEIDKPDIELMLAGDKNSFLPFADTTSVTRPAEKPGKRAVLSFFLKKIALTNAAFHINNKGKQRTLEIENFNIGIGDLTLDQHSGNNYLKYSDIDLYVGSCKATMKKGPFQQMQFKDFSINIDSLEIENSIDTTTFHFNEFTAGLNGLDVITKDSVFNVMMDSFKLSYKNKSISLGNVSLKQNISKAEMQSKYKYQHAQISGSVGDLEVRDIDFDLLIYHNSVWIDEILVNDVTLNIYKDKTRPMDFSKFPSYLGQKITAIREPLFVRSLKASNVNVYSTEKKPDGKMAKVQVNRINATVDNITNRSKNKGLTIQANAYLDNKIRFDASLAFSYVQPQVAFDARFEKFNFTDLNQMISQFTPAIIHAGVVDEIHVSGTAFRTFSTGTMKFLFHDLEIDLKLKDQAEWKNDVVAFAANTILSKDNPASADMPPRIVKFQVARDMNKGFINILLKSALTGLKETIIMSKENKKAYNKAKKKAKRDKKR